VVIIEGEGAVWGVNSRRPILTNGDFVASLCGSAYSDRAVVWRGEWGWPSHLCVRWESTCLKGKGLFLAWFRAFSASAHALVSIGVMMLRNAFDSCVKSWQYFRMHGIPLNFVSYSLSYDVVRFKIKVGVEEKFTCKLYQNERNTPTATVGITLPCAVAICTT